MQILHKEHSTAPYEDLHNSKINFFSGFNLILKLCAYKINSYPVSSYLMVPIQIPAIQHSFCLLKPKVLLKVHRKPGKNHL